VLAYSDPWARSFALRQADFFRGSRRVAYLYEHPDNSTFRYRVYNMLQALSQGDHGISASYFQASEFERIGHVIDACDTLVICRSRYSASLIHLITRARRKGKRVLYDVDDLVVDPDRIHLILNTLDVDVFSYTLWDEWFAYVGRLGAAMRACDGVITTNPFLAGRIESCSGLPCAVIPNFMNREQLEYSERIFREKAEQGFARSGPIHLGYFSGSPTHNKDLALATSALARLLDLDSRLKLVVVGYMDLKNGLARHEERVERYPFQDFVNLQRLIGSVELNLMPLQDNDFTNCKSELKYFEAGAVGTVSVASPTYTYASAITHGVNGFLARDCDWEPVLEQAIASLDRYPELAANARQDSLGRFSWNQYAPLIEKVLFDSWEQDASRAAQ
jgi:glycosyltransferase involved in cell wall biosynthesis